MGPGSLCSRCQRVLKDPHSAQSEAFQHTTRGGRPGGIRDVGAVAGHDTPARYVAGVVAASRHGAQLLPPKVDALDASVAQLDILVPALPGCTQQNTPGNPLVTFPLTPSFQSAPLGPAEYEWACEHVDGFAEIVAGNSRTHLELITGVDATGIMRYDDGVLLGGRGCDFTLDKTSWKSLEPESSFTGPLLGRSGCSGIGDSVSGFVAGICHIRLCGARHTAPDGAPADGDLEGFIARGQHDGGFEAERHGGTYLNEDISGDHTDGGLLHETVVEVWGCAYCSLSEQQRAEADRLLATLLRRDRFAAMPVVPDAHVGLQLPRLGGMMVAHFHVWRHWSIQHPLLGRYGTAVWVA